MCSLLLKPWDSVRNTPFLTKGVRISGLDLEKYVMNLLKRCKFARCSAASGSKSLFIRLNKAWHSNAGLIVLRAPHTENPSRVYSHRDYLTILCYSERRTRTWDKETCIVQPVVVEYRLQLPLTRQRVFLGQTSMPLQLSQITAS